MHARPNPLAARAQIARETQLNLARPNKSRVRPKWRACSQTSMHVSIRNRKKKKKRRSPVSYVCQSDILRFFNSSSRN